MKSNLFQIVSFNLVPRIPPRWSWVGETIDEILTILFIIITFIITLPVILLLHEGSHCLIAFILNGRYPRKIQIRVNYLLFETTVIIKLNKEIKSKKIRWCVSNVIYLIPALGILLPVFNLHFLWYTGLIFIASLLNTQFIVPSVLDLAYIQNLSLDEYLEKSKE